MPEFECLILMLYEQDPFVKNDVFKAFMSRNWDKFLYLHIYNYRGAQPDFGAS